MLINITNIFDRAFISGGKKNVRGTVDSDGGIINGDDIRVEK